jgi:cytochrome c-type biogenesis protein
MSVMTARSALAPRAPLIAVLAIATLAIAGVAVAITRVPSPAVELPSAGANTASLLAGAERRAVLEGGRLDLSVILATTAYFRATGQEKMGAQLGADTGVVLLFAEDVHSGDLPAQLRPILTLDGRAYEVSRAEVLVDATHHRVTALAYSDPHLTLVDPAVKTLALEVSGATDELRWDRPFGASSASAPVLSVPMILALFGGLLASMWPCLLQLSAYFLPSVAGLSLVETEGGAKRMSVLKTAVLFVSGIVIVYTLAGAAAGYAAQSLGGNNVFEEARGPITFVAGLVVLGMAIRIAVQARAPLVCKMPVLGMAGRFGNGPLGTVALGLAFATGCMTCFGAALVLGMFTYVVTTASVLTGATILFLFSLGIAVPLVLAAVAMAKVLPLLGHLERNARYLSLASAAIMAVYAVLLLTGSTHLMSDAIASIGIGR